MKLLFIFIFFITSQIFAQDITIGYWNAQLQLNEKDVLPFTLKVNKNNQLSIINAKEIIQLDRVILKNDSLRVHFPFFNSELIFITENKELKGYWVNYQKGPNYKIPFTAILVDKKTPRFLETINKKHHNQINEKWKVKFEPGTDDEYLSVGLFTQEKNKVTGTFLTETGDYRFLEGNITNDSLFLSCFDGSHAFLFKALFRNDSLIGTFNSGTHWESNWNGVIDSEFELKDPEKITYIIDDQPIEFSLPNLHKDTIHFPSKQFDNKVVIIQIMGTWCPNCLDETIYFKKLYKEYNSQGLEIISVCFEAGKFLDDYIENVNLLKNKLELKNTFLIGGSAKKNTASKQFYMLNSISSFPTTIIIGRDGKVKQIHTGFNGPGTGEYFTTYKKRLNTLIQSLLNIH